RYDIGGLIGADPGLEHGREALLRREVEHMGVAQECAVTIQPQRQQAIAFGGAAFGTARIDAPRLARGHEAAAIAADITGAAKGCTFRTTARQETTDERPEAHKTLDSKLLDAWESSPKHLRKGPPPGANSSFSSSTSSGQVSRTAAASRAGGRSPRHAAESTARRKAQSV